MAELPDPYANLKDAVRREERERCARIADRHAKGGSGVAEYIAAAIRKDDP